MYNVAIFIYMDGFTKGIFPCTFSVQFSTIQNAPRARASDNSAVRIVWSLTHKKKIWKMHKQRPVFLFGFSLWLCLFPATLLRHHNKIIIMAYTTQRWISESYIYNPRITLFFLLYVALWAYQHCIYFSCLVPNTTNASHHHSLLNNRDQRVKIFC